MESMRLQRKKTRVTPEGKQYHQWAVTLPNDLVVLLGWEEGCEVMASVEDGAMVLRWEDESPLAPKTKPIAKAPLPPKPVSAPLPKKPALSSAPPESVVEAAMTRPPRPSQNHYWVGGKWVQ